MTDKNFDWVNNNCKESNFANDTDTENVCNNNKNVTDRLVRKLRIYDRFKAISLAKGIKRVVQ